MKKCNGGLFWKIGMAMAMAAMLGTMSARAETANPADAQSAASVAEAAPPAHLASWQLPEIVVVDKAPTALREENRIGTYGQPRWTATRRFPTTRVYIVPEGKLELEYWLRATFKKDGTTAYRSLYEAEVGLPHRFQFDIYLRTDETRGGENDGEVFQSQQLELRYALADWGKLPGNPTLYLEWIRHDQRDEPDQIEPKLLLGGDLCPHWHWGLNFVGEFQTGGELEREYSVRSGVSYAVRDSRLAVGAECQASFTDTKENRGTFEDSVVLGPSVQYHPFPQMTMNFAPLFGVTEDSPTAQVWFNCGWEF
jgi:hypothetical protein